MNTNADLDQQNNVATFVGDLQQLGWTDGRNVRIEIRWGMGDANRIRSNATEVVALAPDIIVATGNASMGPLLQATHSVPIVFTSVADPVGAGYVDSLARPGGNVTGFLQFEYPLSGKWLELLKQIAPGVTRAAVLRDPAIRAGVGQFAIIQSLIGRRTARARRSCRTSAGCGKRLAGIGDGGSSSGAGCLEGKAEGDRNPCLCRA
jgi:putative ABC transport system substrate-binding protein